VSNGKALRARSRQSLHFSTLRTYKEERLFLCPLLSGYQVQHENRPNIFEVIKVEVVWNVGQHFGTVREKLDRFSTFGGFGGEERFIPSRRG
jgi:predicted Zn-dependent protease with MMP-like domain